MRGHPLTALVIALCAFTSNLNAQQPLLLEPFSTQLTGVFPPTGWTETNAGTAPVMWADAATAFPNTSLHNLFQDAAGHDFSSPGVQCESYLISPALNFSSVTVADLQFLEEYDWINYMAHIPNALGNGVSTVEVSLDGGLTWAVIWTAAPTPSLVLSYQTIDLAAWIGQPSVSFAWHYSGSYAHAWAVDDVVVGAVGGPTAPTLSLAGPCPGPANLVGNGMTPYGKVALYATLLDGNWIVPNGGCAGISLPASAPFLLPPAPQVVADSSGAFQLPGILLSGHCGIMLGAVDITTCTPTSLVRL